MEGAERWEELTDGTLSYRRKMKEKTEENKVG
jgi:hypothetical protein